jgi:hypothetical protein
MDTLCLGTNEEDASFDQVYPPQKIELPTKAKKNHGRDESWPLLMSLKMAGLLPARNGVQSIRRESPYTVPTSLSPYQVSLRNDSRPVPTRGKFTACAYHVNNFADLFLGIAGVMRRFSSRSRQIKKFRLSAKFRNVSCSGVNNFSHARESIALVKMTTRYGEIPGRFAALSILSPFSTYLRRKPERASGSPRFFQRWRM